MSDWLNWTAETPEGATPDEQEMDLHHEEIHKRALETLLRVTELEYVLSYGRDPVRLGEDILRPLAQSRIAMFEVLFKVAVASNCAARLIHADERETA